MQLMDFHACSAFIGKNCTRMMVDFASEAKNDVRIKIRHVHS